MLAAYWIMETYFKIIKIQLHSSNYSHKDEEESN
jgi:hypothetical protein